MWKEEERRRNNAKFSGHYVRPRRHNVRVHTLRSNQFGNKVNLMAFTSQTFDKRIMLHIKIDFTDFEKVGE